MAGSKYIRIAKRLQTACKKQFNLKLLIDQRQWYHKDKDMPITVYTLYRAEVNDKNRTTKTQLFQTYSQIQLVLYLRDLWYSLNHWEVPTDNKVWEELKRKYVEQKEPTDTDPSITNGVENQSIRWPDSGGAEFCNELYTGWKCNRSGETASGSSEAE